MTTIRFEFSACDHTFQGPYRNLAETAAPAQKRRFGKGDLEGLVIHDGTHGIYPEHWRTGKRGYLGKVKSVAERLHIQNIEPLTDSIRRANWQSAQRLAPGLSFSGLCSSAIRDNNTPTEQSAKIIWHRNAVLSSPEAQKTTFREGSLLKTYPD